MIKVTLISPNTILHDVGICNEIETLYWRGGVIYCVFLYAGVSIEGGGCMKAYNKVQVGEGV